MVFPVHQQRSLPLAIFLCLATISDMAKADESLYTAKIKPLLETKCYSCHGVLKQEAGLRLETLSLMKAGGDSGPAVVADNADRSALMQRITADEDSRMPPSDDGAALTSDEIALLRRWIEEGAPAPDEPVPQSPSEHWAFQKITRPQLPGPTAGTDEPQSQQATANPIDILLASKHTESHLQLQPAAQRSLLIRRLYLDLTGLPPSLEELDDQRPYAVIVQKLLASPHHGERWGRHWMDVWRYSDWYGLGNQLRYSQKHMWRWRDWIITSLNNDKGYDRMIQEMLAGDELDPTNLDVVAGTGFLARNYYLFNRTTWLDQTIEHTGKAFLGLTLNCAKCHDHKYDPLTHVDYYNFRAIFEPHQVRLDPVPGEINFDKDGLPRVFDDHLNAETFLHVKGDPANSDTETQITPRVPAILAAFQPEIEPILLPMTAYAPATRDYVQNDLLKAVDEDIKAAESELSAARAALARAHSKTLSDPQSQHSDFSFADDFAQPNPEAWDIVGDGWQYGNGSLTQTMPTRDSQFVRLKQQLPRDFELTCRFTTTGGTTYKSVTFRFDQSEDSRYDNFVYTSAHSPGPKIQVAYTRNGSMSYPNDGRASQPIKIGEPQTLKFAIRDNLVNAWWNGDFALAYMLPNRSPDGRFTMSGFDATVTFDEISLRSLPNDVQLVPAKNSVVHSQQEPDTAVRIAEAKVKASKAKRESLKATIAAEKEKHDTNKPQESSTQLIDAAAILQAEAKRSAGEFELLSAGSDSKKANAAREKIALANKLLTAAKQGEGTYHGLRTSRKALETPEHKEGDYPATYPTTSTGRRLALARWMTSLDNPLTARVAVNHVWMRHFGEPLVESVFDFGLRTKQPLHQDVLDFLAVEFMESGWSFKHLHYLIVTSKAYQRSSGINEVSMEIDPANLFYWRMHTRRMESQIIRDSLLQLSGTLDAQIGGPSLPVGNDSLRRSVYFKHSRDDQDKFLTMFDDADLLQCYRRSASVVPQQALALANSQLSITKATLIADRISKSLNSPDNGEFVNVAIRLLLGREATELERTACLEYCDHLSKLQRANQGTSAPAAKIRQRLIHSLLNHNDFITIR